MNKKRETLPRNPLSGLLGNADNTNIPDTPGQVDNTNTPSKVDKADSPDDFVVRSVKIRRVWVEKIDRIAYWERQDKQDVLDSILEAALQHVVKDPIPEEGKVKSKYRK